MGCISLPDNRPSPDTVDPVQECQELLIEIDELNKQKEEHRRQLAMCEVTAEKKKKKSKMFIDRKTNTAKKTIKLSRVNLDEHKDFVAGYLKNIKKLQSAYREQIIGVLKNADPVWLYIAESCCWQHSVLQKIFTV